MKNLILNSLTEICACTFLLCFAVGVICFFAAATPTPAEDLARIAALGCR